MYKLLVGIFLAENAPCVFDGCIGRECDVHRAEHASAHGNEMRSEGNLHSFAMTLRQSLLDFGHMAVPRHAVCVHTFCHLSIQECLFRSPPRTTHAALGVNGDVIRGDALRFQQWAQRQLHARGIAAWIRDECDTRLGGCLHGVTLELREPVHSLLLKVRSCVRRSIPLLVLGERL